MKQAGRLLVTLLLVGLLVSLALGAERLQISQITGLIWNDMIIQPFGINPIPIGREGHPTGFAFAPGRAELAYSKLERQGKASVSVLRIAKLDYLWTVFRTRPKTTTEEGRTVTIQEGYYATMPFTERERELLSLPVIVSGDRLRSPFIEGPILWSADGSKLAVFVVTENLNKMYATRDLWLIDYGSGKRQELTRGAWVTETAWSADSRWLAFAAEQGEGKPAKSAPPATRPGLYVAAAQTGAIRWIAEGGLDLEWSPTNRLSFRRQGDSPQGQEYNPATKQLSPVKVMPQPESPWQLSPDRRYLAVVEESPSGRQLELRERASDSRLFSLPAAEMGGWYPDSRMLTYFGKDGKLKMTAVVGPHRGHSAEVTEAAELDLLPFHPPVAWSSPVQFNFLPPGVPWPAPGLESKQKPLLSWLAYISQGQLRVQQMIHRLPAIHEAVALDKLPLEDERMLVLNNMKQVALAVLMYSNDWDELAPPPAVALRAIDPYLGGRQLLDRPGYPDQPVVRYLVTNPRAYRELQRPAEVPMAIVEYMEDGDIIAFCDGHVKWVRKELVPDILRIAEEAFSSRPRPGGGHW